MTLTPNDASANNGFAFELRSALLTHTFNLEEALKISDKLHEFELSGGELTRSVDRMWESLTVKIESAKASSI